MSKPLPLICEKCHRRRLHPIADKGHRWCKQCRAEAHARLADPSAEPPPTADEKRLIRTVYGKYTKYDFEAARDLLVFLHDHYIAVRQLSTRKHYSLKTKARHGTKGVHFV